MTPETARKLSDLGASEQAIEKLKKYTELLEKWQKAINLVAPSTLGDLWGRHILDSAQLYPIIRNACASEGFDGSGRIIDLGSGGGLPGIVLAAMGVEHITLIESDTRKCVFLSETARALGLDNVTVLNKRIESVDPGSSPGLRAGVITARALAPLKTLVEWASPMLLEGGMMVFPKGETWAGEVADLGGAFHVEHHPSMTDARARVVVLKKKG